MPPETSFEYPLKSIGGYNFSEKKCIFSLDGKLLLAISGSWIKIHVVSSGIPYGSLCAQQDSNCPRKRNDLLTEKITNLQLDPNQPDSSVISYTNTGRVIFWDYVRLKKDREYNIFESLYCSYSKSLEMLYGIAVKPNDDADLKEVTFYFATIAEGSPRMYHCTVDYIEKCIQEDKTRLNKKPEGNKRRQSKKDIAKMEEKIAMDRLKNDNIYIRFNPDLALVGITIGGRNSFMAAIEECFINIVHLPYRKNGGGISHKIARNTFTCLTAHPKEFLLAAGDSLGRIYIYREDFCRNVRPIRSVTHWHHSPVNDLCFSPSGAYLYSGGFESVLVRWDVSHGHDANYYPRLGAPIRYVVCDSLNEKILTCHADNTFHCISSNMDSHLPVLDGLTLLPQEDFLRTPNNIAWDPKSSCIVLKGKCGHLQFYSPTLGKQLFQLDVVGMNYIPPEADKHIVNVDVERFSVSQDGNWISTIEYREDGVIMPEMRLKFWKYMELSEAKYMLNTYRHLPHKKPVNNMRFSMDGNHCITTSQDLEFKIWDLIRDETSSKDDVKYWICGRTGNLNRVLAPDKIAGSSDFSILAISFASNTTLWDTSELSLEFKGTFLPPKSSPSSSSDEESTSSDQIIESIEFGTGTKSHLLAETRATSFRVWNLLTLSVHQIWYPPKNVRINFSLFDQQTNRSALFLTNGFISILEMEKELAQIQLGNHTQLDVGKFISGLFLPQIRSKRDDIFSKSALCLMDESQRLYSVGLGDDEDESLPLINPDDDDEEEEENLTPYARMLLREKQKFNIEEKLKRVELNDFFGPSINRKKLVEDVFTNVPSHVLPPVETFCTSFLTSLLQSNNANKETIEGENNVKTRSNDSSDDEDEEKEVQAKDGCSGEELMELDDTSTEHKRDFVFNESYDWLKVV